MTMTESESGGTAVCSDPRVTELVTKLEEQSKILAGDRGASGATTDAACQGGGGRRGEVTRRWQRRRARRGRVRHARHTAWGANWWSWGGRSPGPPIRGPPAGKQSARSLDAADDGQMSSLLQARSDCGSRGGVRRC